MKNTLKVRSYSAHCNLDFEQNIQQRMQKLCSTENIRKYLDDNQSTAAAFLDLSEAFNSVSHEISLEKLLHLDFDQKTIKMMSFLTGRYQMVKLSICS